jgi:exonuclease III
MVILPLFLLYLVTIYGETFCPIVSSALDNRPNKSKLRIMQYNVEWLFVDYYTASDCPGDGCSWKNKNDAIEHINYISTIIRELKPDILNLCEIEGCDELSMLSNSTLYKPYSVKGKDSSTGQNVGVLTLIDPIINLYRNDERVNYPISGSTCGYTGEPGDSGVSKHYTTEYKINGLNIAMIGAHLVAFPTDPARCAQREAQAQILQNIISTYISKKIEVVVMGDFNDFDGEVLDSNNNKPLSSVLDIIKGKKGSGSYELISAAEKIEKTSRYTDWWDQNKNCNSTSTEFSMIDHILVTPALFDKISTAFIYHEYEEYCGTFNSDHYPVIVDFMI